VPAEATKDLNGKIKAINIGSVLRFYMPAAVFLYCACYQWSYVKWLSPVWGYMGLKYNSPDSMLLLTAYVLAAVLCVFSPQKLRRPSQVIYWLLYFTVYIPGMLTPLFMQYVGALSLLLLELSLTGGMLLIAISYRMRLINIRRYPINRQLFWTIFFIVFALSNVMLLVVFRDSLHLASLKEVYDVRAGASRVVEQNPGIGYVSILLSNVMNPLLIAYGLSVHKRRLVLLGALGEVLVYSTAAMKSVLLSPLFIIMIYYSVKKDRGGWVPKFCLLCCATFFICTTLVVGHKEGFIFNLTSITVLRSFAIPGSEIAEYQHFFENFPHTYLAHVHGVSLFVSNPYSMALGKEIGYFYTGASPTGSIGNANVTFFAMDGIAGFGLPGILIMGIVCAAMFWVLDSCARKYTVAFCASALAGCAISLTNSSLFTSFLGGGIMLFMLLFIVMPRDLLGEDSAG